jgi:glycosyltransferase involved in cell wall biosynthesis
VRAEAKARPLVSVVIPHLNQPDSLRICLQSLAAQDWPAERTEIIVVDNGSRELPDLAALGFPQARLLQEATPGPGPARNRGIAEASGEILAFIDADCRADPHWLSAAVAGLSAPGSTGVVGGDVRIDMRDPARLTPLEAYEAVFAYRQQLYIARDGYSGTGNLAMRREVFDRVGPFGSIHTAEDMDWGQRARAAGHPAQYRADMIVYHPARTDMAELQTKWRRHVAHTLVMHRQRGRSDLVWAARAGVVLASAAPHALKLMTSPRLSGLGNRLRGLGVLFSIRSWRAREMLRQRAGSATAGSESWNREAKG